jgi:predicted RNA-binding Zn-ribbon protein involved in translation (DUF1610 family)
MVEVPKGTDNYGKDKSLWALDTVTMEEAKEDKVSEDVLMNIHVTNNSLKLVKKLKLVTASDFKRYYCKKCRAYFDTKSKYITFKCSMCGEMNQITDDMAKSLKNVHTFDANDLRVIEEGEGNYILICGTNGESKIKAERIVS